MAGCFGNHPFDRAMEQQLYGYLADCDSYEQLCEQICRKIHDDLWDKHDDYASKIIDKYLGIIVERGIMSMEEAQNMLLKLVMRVDLTKSTYSTK